MRKVLLLITFILFYSFTTFSQDFSVSYNNPPSLNLCETGDFEVTVTSNGISANNLGLQIFLPQGIMYIGNSVQNAQETTNLSQSEPLFSIPTIAENEKIIVRFSVRVLCDALDLIDDGSLFQNFIRLEHDTSTVSLSTNPYLVETPLIILESVTPNAFTGYENQEFTRQIIIKNTRLGRANMLEFRDSHQGGISISTSLASGEEIGNTYTATIGPAEFRSIGNGDEYFDKDEEFIIEEQVRITDCGTINFTDSEITVDWGCYGQVCGTDFLPARVNISPTPNQPFLNTELKSSFPPGYCTNLPFLDELTISNTGFDTAFSPIVTLKNLGPAEYAIDISTIEAFHDNNTLSYQILAKTTPACLAPADYADSISLKINGAVPPLEDITIQYGYRECNFECNQTTPSIGYEVLFENNCEVDMPQRISGQTDWGNDPFFILDSLQLNIGGYLEDGQTYQGIYKVYSSLLTQELGFFRIQFQLDCGIEWLNNDFILDGKSPIFANITPRFGGETMVELVYDLPFSKNYLTETFSFQYNFDPQCIDIQKIDYPPITTCEESFSPEYPGGPILIDGLNGDADISTKSAIIENLANRDCGIADCDENTLRWQYDTLFIPDSDQSIIRGYISPKGSFERKSVGLKDTNDDREADIPLTQANREDVELTHFIPGDTAITQTYGTVVVDEPGATFKFAKFRAFFMGFSSDEGIDNGKAGSKFLNEGAFLRKSFEPLGTSLKVYDASTFRYYQAPIFVTDVIENSLIESYVPNTIPRQVLYQVGQLWFEYTINPSLLSSYGFPQNFVFEEGDSIFIESSNVVNFNPVKQGPELINLRYYSSISIYDDATSDEEEFTCGIVQTPFQINGYELDVHIDSVALSPCDIDPFPIQTDVALRFAAPNFFPGEVRQFFNVRNWQFFYPNFLSINSGVVEKIQLQDGPILFGPENFPRNTLFNPVGINFSRYNSTIEDEGLAIETQGEFQGNECKNGNSNLTYLFLGLDFFHKFPEFPLRFDSLYYNLRGATVLKPALSTFIPTQSIVNTNTFVRWQLQLRNDSIHTAKFAWMKAHEGENLYNLRLVHPITGDTLLASDGIFQLGNIENGQPLDLEILAENGGCGGRDSVLITYGWNCSPFEGLQGDIPCWSDSLYLRIKTIPASFEMAISSPTEPVNLCDTLPYHTVEVYNANFNKAVEIKFQVELPPGVIIAPGSCEIAYPKGNLFRRIPDPRPLAGNTFQWEMEQIEPAIQQNGLPGYTQAPSNSFLIRFKSITTCGVATNNPIVFKVEGLNTVCPDPTNILSRSGNPLQINGLEDLYEGRFLLANGQDIEISCEDELSVSIMLEHDGPTGSTDSIMVALPPGANYTAGSISPNGNLRLGEPLILFRNGRQHLFWGLPANIPSDEIISFDIRIENITGDACEPAKIELLAFQNRRLICATDNRPCETNITTDSVVLSIRIQENQLDWQGLSATTDGPLSNQVHFSGNLINNGGTITNGVVFFYIDKNNNGQVDASDSLLFDVNLGQIEAGEQGIIDYTVELNRYEICNIIALLPIDENCLCTPQTITIQEVQFAVEDTTICSNQPILLGVNDQVGHQYIWSFNHSHFSCSNCPSGTFQYNNQDTTSNSFSLRLEEFFDNCLFTYDYNITVAPVLDIINNDTTICEGERITLTANQNNNFLWQGPEIDNLTNQQISLTLDSSTYIYLVQMDTTSCKQSDSVFINVLPNPIADAGSDTTFCNDGSIYQLEALNQPDYQYNWTPASLFQDNQVYNPFLISNEDGFATLQVSNDGNCIDTDTIYFSFIPQPDIVTEEIIQLCAGETQQLLTAGAESFSWFPPDFLSCTNCANPYVTPDTSIVYTLLGSNENQCFDTTTVSIEILGATIRDSTFQAICASDSFFFNGQWLFEPGFYIDSLINPATSCDSISFLQLDVVGDIKTMETIYLCDGDSTFIIDRFVSTVDTAFTIYNTTSAGCDSTHRIELLRAPSPNISQLIYEIDVRRDTAISFDLPVGFSQYNWTPTTGLSCADCPNPIITIMQDSLSYFVEVINEEGCSVTIRVNINPTSLCAIEKMVIPNVFTPNGDGENDFFTITGEVPVENITRMKIFSRWGEKIFEASGSRAVWDGTIEGVAVPSDVYMYQIEIGCYDDKEVLAGDITVLR